MARGGASPGMGCRGVSHSNPATLKVRVANRMERKMKLQDLITKLSDLDPEKDYNFTLAENKLDVDATEKKPEEKKPEENEELENLKKEVEDLKKVNKTLLEKTTMTNNDSVEDIVATIVGLKKEE